MGIPKILLDISCYVASSLCSTIAHPARTASKIHETIKNFPKHETQHAVPRNTEIHNRSLISVIIPAYNEERDIQQTLRSLDITHKDGVEVIVADGGSKDGTTKLASEMGIRVVDAPSGRAKCMNFGASLAKGDILLFLHADTILPRNYDELIRETMAVHRNYIGAFQFCVDKSRLSRFKYAQYLCMEFFTNLRAKYLQLPYGDQALFVRRSVFDHFGKYPDMPFMEDFQFVRNVNKHGRICILNAAAVTSTRRWLKLGLWTTCATNQLVVFAYTIGMSTEQMRQWYYGPQKK